VVQYNGNVAGRRMKVAIVHDSIGEFGGAERVLLALSEIWTEAPIYTSFTRRGPFLEKLKGKDIRVSWAHYVPFFATKLHSPLRFLAPLIWGSFDFSKYDVVISSSSWYINKGYGQGGPTSLKLRGAIGRPIEFCYCHTPPRWLYGFDSPADKKNPIVKAYIVILAHFMRIYDFEKAQKVNYFIANSENKRNYYLIVSRITGGKGIEMAVEAANKLGFALKIAGSPSGYSQTYEWVKKNAGPTVELLGYVPDEELGTLYAGAKAFLAVQKDEDFGMTLPEALSWGTPVIAYNGGGYPESVTHGKTGILFDEYSVHGLIGGIKELGKIRVNPENCIKQAQKFSSARFKKEIQAYILSKLKVIY